MATGARTVTPCSGLWGAVGFQFPLRPTPPLPVIPKLCPFCHNLLGTCGKAVRRRAVIMLRLPFYSAFLFCRSPHTLCLDLTFSQQFLTTKGGCRSQILIDRPRRHVIIYGLKTQKMMPPTAPWACSSVSPEDSRLTSEKGGSPPPPWVNC